MREFPMIAGVGHNCLDRLCTVEDYPPEDGSTHITSISIQGGGAVATAVAAAARLGVSAAWIGYLGEDGTGREIRRLLEEDGELLKEEHRELRRRLSEFLESSYDKLNL